MNRMSVERFVALQSLAVRATYAMLKMSMAQRNVERGVAWEGIALAARSLKINLGSPPPGEITRNDIAVGNAVMEAVGLTRELRRALEAALQIGTAVRIGDTGGIIRATDGLRWVTCQTVSELEAMADATVPMGEILSDAALIDNVDALLMAMWRNRDSWGIAPPEGEISDRT